MGFVKVIILLVFIPSEGLAVKLDHKGSSMDYQESQNMQLEKGIGSVHSRLRSVFKNTKKNRKRRRKLKADETWSRMSSKPAFIEYRNFNLTDSSKNRWKKLQRIKDESDSKMPKIYITKLPVENNVKDQ